MKYARTTQVGSEVRLVDVVEIPSPLPEWATDILSFLTTMYGQLAAEFVQVANDNLSGAVQQQDGTFLNPVSPAPPPKLLSKTAFQDYAISKLGGGVTGMARFTEIMDATRDSASGAVRFGYARYEAADIFEKSNTATLTAIMASDTQTGHLTSDERAAIIGDDWPTG